jgi:TRAP-type C4-dicarboxylate transport system permease large subunit
MLDCIMPPSLELVLFELTSIVGIDRLFLIRNTETWMTVKNKTMTACSNSRA